jgi:hypothetical protein
MAGQASGAEFETITVAFIKETFLSLGHLRPGKWEVTKLNARDRVGIARFDQYEHLVALQNAAKIHPDLASALGRDYLIAPDTVVVRHLEEDSEINRNAPVVDSGTATYASLRARPGGLPLLHASVSCKWTIRSDRAQNTRTEALNMMRNRKGHLPHIVVVTGEPLPSRIASIALGTGDIDCVYHFALPELIATVDELDIPDSREMVRIMVEGKRLKDISDLPLDLAV